MEKIKRYIENFQKRHKENVRFSMNLNELFDAVHLVEEGEAAKVIANIFSYGYAKGYRAAQAEMKQGGAA
jgi:hypothetical protein